MISLLKNLVKDGIILESEIEAIAVNHGKKYGRTNYLYGKHSPVCEPDIINLIESRLAANAESENVPSAEPVAPDAEPEAEGIEVANDVPDAAAVEVIEATAVTAPVVETVVKELVDVSDVSMVVSVAPTKKVSTFRPVNNYTNTRNDFYNDLPKRIRANLISDNSKYREADEHINGLICPVCGKPEAYAHLDKPMAIMCHRNNQCGATTPIKSVYPELWEDLAKLYPPTPANPKATAKAYLESRAISPELVTFNQGKVDNHQTLVIESSDGVIFQRLIDYTGTGKNRLSTYKGKVYEAPYEGNSNVVFITEGIIDALSFAQIGQQAIATYSSSAIPEPYYKENTDCHFIIGFDSDNAGITGTRKTIECFEKLGIVDYQIALPPRGYDWNQLLVAGQLTEETIKESLWRGRLEFSAEPGEYFLIYLEKYPNTKSLVFKFNQAMYKAYQAQKEGEELQIKTKRLTDCT